ncbi:hypothetical protein LTR37_004731 [Vermiconidia calcicola]|uniref:Uncharacterized protein n=1 Tax=Vermiconidia calcicola TaxID=1690605 RepID=A0ACC3NLA2_9PEZI|nr:hypothetical protein LTR37_004731 [Vermiconidia calcicola]
MNPQASAYPQYPPPPTGHQTYPYQFEYPPPPPAPQISATPPQPGRAYQYPSYPQQGQQQAQYFRSYQGTPKQPPQAAPQAQQSRPPLPLPAPQQTLPTPQPQTLPPPRPQTRQQQNEHSSSPSSPDAASGAAQAEPASPEVDDFDQQLMDALNNDNAQQPPIANAPGPPNVGDENEPIYNLPPPPENTYPSEAELEKAMHAWSLEHGFELVRRASKKNSKGEQYKRYYHCSKHGMKISKLQPEDRRRVNRKSNRMGCVMSVATVAVDPNNPQGEWQVRHRKTHHNHPALDVKSLAGHRRRAREGGVQKAVDGLFAIGTSTAQVMQFLKKTNPNGLFTRTDVANMKLKWKKYGTCMVTPSQGESMLAKGDVRIVKTTGIPSACHSCRQKKVACNSVKPVCGTCTQRNTQCVYDPEREETRAEVLVDPATSLMNSQMDYTMTTPTPAAQQQQQQQQQQALTEASATPSSSRPRGRANHAQAAATKEILDELRSFQNDHIVPQRVDLQTSSVEILAQTSCGTGESYKALPFLTSMNDWAHFRDAMVEAAMKENTYDVLAGSKSEPRRPISAPADEGKPTEIEQWNEYIKQLAIYKRRNGLLLSALWSRMAPNYRTRVNSLTNAAAVWNVLEDLFQPRGCETAFRLYLDLHSITLSNSADLKDYIHRLQSTYDKFKQLKLNTSPPPLNRGVHVSPVREGGEAVPEEMVCFLFLQNLGPEWRRWVEGLCATNNIGGFGTGERLGLKDLCKRAVGYEAMQRRELGR